MKKAQSQFVIAQRKASKRLPVFTPIAKPSKKSKSCFDPKFDININTEGINDESIFLVSESRESDANLEENVMLTGLFSCDKCNFDTEVDNDLKEHMIDIRDSFTWKVCIFVFQEESALERDRETHKLENMETEEQLNGNNGERVEEQVSTSPLITEGDTSLQDSIVVCSTCGQGFVTEIECIAHMTTHIEPILHKCMKCNIGFDTELNLYWHIETEHEKEEDVCDTENEMDEVIIELELFKCCTCTLGGGIIPPHLNLN